LGVNVEHLLKVTCIGLFSGIIGTGTGGLMAFFINKISNRTLCLILEFSAGLMTAVVCFELLPGSLELGGAAVTLAGIILGVGGIVLIENYIRKLNIIKRANGSNSLIKAGILVAVGIGLHNFPEGFAVGSGFEASVGLGLTLTAVIAIHDIPEGIAMAVPLRAGGLSKAKAFLFSVLSGVPMGFGALIGAALGEISHGMVALCLSFAGGAMLYIVYGELVAESKKLYGGRLPALGNVIGLICGIIVSIYN
jgi:ZIP family zinc transporter